MSLKLTNILDRRLIWLVTLTFTIFAVIPSQTRAALIESHTSDGVAMSQRADDLEKVRTMLEKEVVVQRLADYGYSKEEASMKIQSASDEQLHQLASLSDSLANGAGALGVVVTLLVIVLLIVLILRINNDRIIITD